MNLSVENRRLKLDFEGEGAAENNYLNSKSAYELPYNLNEADFISGYQSFIENTLASFDSLGFSPNFKLMEARRLPYVNGVYLKRYPRYHIIFGKAEGYIASENYYDLVRSYVIDDGSLLQFISFKEIIPDLVKVLAFKERKDKWDLASTEYLVDYVINNFKDAKLISFLVDNYVTECINRCGVDNTEKLVKIFDEKVLDKEAKIKFASLYARWTKLAKGQPSPTFTYKDVNGKEVSLSDLKGKYVYIDCWATWCHPCCAEIPYLEKIEKAMANKNIYFVSISQDQDHDKWVKKVKGDKMGGIQLITGGDRSFLNAYNINGIPRFILLDKEGNIISCAAPRPSFSETLPMLMGLDGI